MNDRTFSVVVGALLHDIGKVAYRSGESGSYSASGYRILKEFIDDNEILDCVRYRHRAEIPSSLSSDALPYIVCIANRIASAADDSTIEGESDNFQATKQLKPLESIFNHMNGAHGEWVVESGICSGKIPYPKSGSEIHPKEKDYSEILSRFLSELKRIPHQKQYADALLNLCEDCFSMIPSDIDERIGSDISMFDQLKMSAAIAGCINEYLQECGEQDLSKRLFREETKFYNEPAFLMASIDFSGIQKFLYTVRTKGALKALRSRSFYLELLMEHTVDEILSFAGVCRANLIYSGGGHCYVLLPNTARAKEAVNTVKRSLNLYLMDNFGVSLYAAFAVRECSANELMNRPAEKTPYSCIFRDLSSTLSFEKLHRYSAEDIIRINSGNAQADGRECKNCGAAVTNDHELCDWCERFTNLSPLIMNSDMVIAISTAVSADSMPLPSIGRTLYAHFISEEEAAKRVLTGDIIRVYSKNHTCRLLIPSTRINICDYAYDNSLEALAEDAEGIRRIAVLRADVDDLGAAFIRGLEQVNETDPARRYRYVTLTRTAAFSRWMSMFFKRYITAVLSGEDAAFTLNGQHAIECKRAAVVYSGGDDVFLIGAWDDVIEAGILIRDAFRRYTSGTLSISAGISLTDPHYPIRKSGVETEELVETSKSQLGKNTVTLFSADEAYAFNWDVFRDSVIGEKYQCVSGFFAGNDSRGMSMLYQLNDYLTNCRNRINLARFAYMLARLKPKGYGSDAQLYDRFMKNMYKWACSDEDRKQLITAISLYVYTRRQRKDEH